MPLPSLEQFHEISQTITSILQECLDLKALRALAVEKPHLLAAVDLSKLDGELVQCERKYEAELSKLRVRQDEKAAVASNDTDMQQDEDGAGRHHTPGHTPTSSDEDHEEKRTPGHDGTGRERQALAGNAEVGEEEPQVESAAGGGEEERREEEADVMEGEEEEMTGEEEEREEECAFQRHRTDLRQATETAGEGQPPSADDDMGDDDDQNNDRGESEDMEGLEEGTRSEILAPGAAAQADIRNSLSEAANAAREQASPERTLVEPSAVEDEVPKGVDSPSQEATTQGAMAEHRLATPAEEGDGYESEEERQYTPSLSPLTEQKRAFSPLYSICKRDRKRSDALCVAAYLQHSFNPYTRRKKRSVNWEKFYAVHKGRTPKQWAAWYYHHSSLVENMRDACRVNIRTEWWGWREPQKLGYGKYSYYALD